MSRKHRQYDNEYPSITELLNLLRKPALEYWFKVNTLEYIETESKKAKEIGTQLTQAIQDHIELNDVKVETQYADEIVTCLKSFMQFKKDFPDIKLHKAEIKMTSDKYKINGTLDALGEDLIWEWKTGKCKEESRPAIYPEHLWQNAGYINLYNDINKTKIKKGCVVVFAKDKVAYNMQEIEGKIIKDSFKNIILPLNRIWQYNHRKE